jgi:hypothetical protein
MRCAQCGAETPDEDWNCSTCRMNVYWASQHFRELADVRDNLGLPVVPDTPPFLRRAHEAAMNERADRGGREEHKVRQIARRAMAQQRHGTESAPARSVAVTPEAE